MRRGLFAAAFALCLALVSSPLLTPRSADALFGQTGTQTSLLNTVISADFFGMHIIFPTESAVPSFGYGIRKISDTFQSSPMSGVPQTQWGFIESTQGVKNWTWLNTVVDQCVAQNKKVFIVLFGSQEPFNTFTVPAWALSNPSDPRSIPDTAKAVQWVNDLMTQILSRPGMTAANLYVDPWNEFNDVGGSYSGTIAQMVTLMQAIYPVLKSYGVTVLSPSASAESGWDFLNAFASNGGYATFDKWNIHGYGTNATYTETLIPFIQTYQNVILGNGQGTRRFGTKDVWISEAGFGRNDATSSDAVRAAYIPKALALAIGAGFSHYNWYAYDTPNGPNPNLIYNGRLLQIGSTSVLRDPGTAWTQAYQWFVGATAVSLNNDGVPFRPSGAPFVIPGTKYWMDLTRSGGYSARLIWTSDGSTPAYPTTGFTRYRDVLGTVTSGLGPTVNLGYSPILLESGAPP